MKRLFEKYPWLSGTQFLFALYTIVIIAATVHREWLFPDTSFNNFSIFRWSFYNLLHGNDLYTYYPAHYADLYKYSPTFSLLMAPFYLLPYIVGIFIWNLLNALVPFWAVNKLNVTKQAKAFVLFFIFIELLGSVQNAQSNGLMAGLMIGAFAAMENRKPFAAALLICLGFYIKLFAAAAGLIFLFYDRKWKFILYCALWGIVLGVLPVLATGINGLVVQYKSWLHLLANDPAHDLNYSFMTLTQRWFRFTAPDSWYLVPGALLLVLPLLRKKWWSSFNFRLMYLASLLVWVVIFNHKAESPTYVIAMSGAALWGIAEPKSIQRTLLLWFVFILTGLSATDLFPPAVRDEIIKPYCLKALPCIVLWCVMTWKLLRGQKWEAAV